MICILNSSFNIYKNANILKVIYTILLNLFALQSAKIFL